MLNKVTYTSHLFHYPYALFREKDCIYQVAIDDIYVLTSFSYHLWKIAESETIVVKHFKGLIFVTVCFESECLNYLLVFLLKECEVSSWNESEWSQLYEKICVGVGILKNQNDYVVKKIETSENYAFSDTEIGICNKKNIEQSHDFLDNYQLEKFFMNQIKSGNPLSLNKLISNLIKINRTNLSQNKLQEKKYRIVALITLLTRASIKEGCAPNSAYRLSDKLIRKMDYIESTHDIGSFLNYLIIEFSILFQKKAIVYSSEIVNKAIEFINSNLYQPVTNKEIAEYTSVHPAYLSQLFKKKVGTSLRQFVIERKINETQFLLCNTDISLKDISELLYFSNQSHFSKLFKEKTGYTPNEFRTLF